MKSRSLCRWIVGLAALCCVAGCAGRAVRAKADSIETRLNAVEKPAYKCAPEDYAVARSELEFTYLKLDQGEYFEAQEHLALALEATEKSELVAPRPECQENRDRDGDGILDREDRCPDDPEDFDGFQDSDGCPDPDNDEDGILDHDDKCPNDPEDLDNFEDEDGCPDPDNDKDNICDSWVSDKGLTADYPSCSGRDACPNDAEDFDGFEDEDGCPDPDNDLDGICDPWVSERGLSAQYAAKCKGIDKCPNEPEDFDGDEDEDGCPDLYKSIIVHDDHIELKQTIYFATNKDVILSKSFGLLNEVAMALRDHAQIRVSIEGHTDSKGKDSYNKKLSQRRAESVRRYLINQGVEASRMEAIGYGEERPIEDNRTAEGRAANRRVEFIIIK